MYPKLTPRDNEYNRKYGFTDDATLGFVMDIKLGQAFWAWKFADGNIKFYKCEKEVFDKNFGVDVSQRIEQEFDPYDSPHFLRYPLEQ